jgi:hypothetical protein
LAALAGIGGESANPPLFAATAAGVGVAVGGGVGLDEAEELQALRSTIESSASAARICGRCERYR